MPKKLWQLVVFQANSTAVDFTIESSGIADAPTLGGQRVYPLEGRTESIPSQIAVLDVGSTFTSRLSDSGGRGVLMRRRAQVQCAVDSTTTFGTVYTGRITNITDHVSHYVVTLLDERHIERTTKIFTSVSWPSSSNAHSTAAYAGTYVLPPGVDGEYQGYQYPTYNGMKSHGAFFGSLTKDNLIPVFIDEPAFNSQNWRPRAGAWATADVLSLLRADMKYRVNGSTAATGNFERLRAYVTIGASSVGADYEVHSIVTGGSEPPDNRPELLSGVEAGIEANWPDNPAPELYAWIVASSSVGADLLSDGGSVRLHLPGHSPTPSLPFHIGGDAGINPFQLVKDVYEEIGVTYSSSGIQDLIDDKWYGKASWIVTEPVIAADWLEQNIYAPYGVIPFVDSEGRVNPRSILMPRSSDAADAVATFPLFTSTGTADQPGWEQSGQEIVTKIRYAFELQVRHEETPGHVIWEKPFGWANAPPQGAGAIPLGQDRIYDSGFKTDLIQRGQLELAPTSSFAEHDRVDNFGVEEIAVMFSGIHNHGLPAGFYQFTTGPSRAYDGAYRFAQVHAANVFSRYGDGPVRGTLVPLSSEVPASSGPEPGSFVRIGIESYPVLHEQARSTAGRVVQILSVEHTPSGPRYETLDVGPALNPLGTPTVTLSSSTSDPRHGLIAAITGLSTGSRWSLQVAQGATAPASTSEAWRVAGEGSTANSTAIILSHLASGTTWWARAVQTALGRIRSLNSTAASKATDSITAPSGLAADSSGRRAILTWTVGSGEYPVDVRLDEATVAASTRETVEVLRAKASVYELLDLNQASTYAAGIRHIDGYGGASTEVTVEFNTSTAGVTSPDFGSLVVIEGVEV